MDPRKAEQARRLQRLILLYLVKKQIWLLEQRAKQKKKKVVPIPQKKLCKHDAKQKLQEEEDFTASTKLSSVTIYDYLKQGDDIKDATQSFCDFLAQEMRKLPELKRIQLQIDISKLAANALEE